MGFYQFKRDITLDSDIETIWDFISNPANLKLITPPYMRFDITSDDTPEKIYEGMIISYIVAPLAGIKTKWVTEITHVRDLSYFVDEQRVGPYKIWHHQHFISQSANGVLMTDIVSYKPPFGFLGSISNRVLISRKLKEIFDFRTKVLMDRFGKV